MIHPCLLGHYSAIVNARNTPMNGITGSISGGVYEQVPATKKDCTASLTDMRGKSIMDEIIKIILKYANNGYGCSHKPQCPVLVGYHVCTLKYKAIQGDNLHPDIVLAMR